MFKKYIALAILIRAADVSYQPIMDCDETFNYLEPLHYEIYGSGFQPWEYSPQYALRSWFYIHIHHLMVQPFFNVKVLTPYPNPTPFEVYTILKSLLGMISAIGEVLFVDALFHKFSKLSRTDKKQSSTAFEISGLTLLFMLLSAGIGHTSVAFIPSSFCMYSVLYAYAAWFRGFDLLGLCIGAYAFTTWPYILIMFIPMSIEYLLKRGFLRTLFDAVVISLLFIGIPSLYDSSYYDKLAIPSVNQIMYNVLKPGGELYGIEPWYFYFVNLVLNFNIVAILAFITPFALVFSSMNSKEKLEYAKIILPTYLWMFISSIQAHKEERFLAMTYPVICLCASLSLCSLKEIFLKALKGYGIIRKFVLISFGIVLLFYCAMSISRGFALNQNFSAPNKLFDYMRRNSIYPDSICYGGEWYRFPSTFLVPRKNEQISKVLWIKSSFNGLLPQPFAPWPNGTSVVPPFMNDRNEEQPEAYSLVNDCDYAVDLVLSWSQETFITKDWEAVKCYPFLDSVKSKPLFRSFLLPFGFSSKFNKYADYCLFRNNAYKAN